MTYGLKDLCYQKKSVLSEKILQNLKQECTLNVNAISTQRIIMESWKKFSLITGEKKR